jgi:pimeloyl-ACP methyl ester carboxylesterase
VPLHELEFDAGELVISYAAGPPSGPPFVVLHGGASRWQYGRELLDLLADQWHVFAPDFRGHGRSGRARDAYRLHDYVRDTVAFLAGVVAEPAVVYGHSLGGEVAVMTASQRPDLFRGLVVGDAPLSNRSQVTRGAAQRAQNELWRRLAGRPVDEIEPALKVMQVPVPGETGTKAAAVVFGDDNQWFEFQARSLHHLDPGV